MDTQAMHISNGIVNGPVSAIFAVFAVVALAVCVRKAATTVATVARVRPDLVYALRRYRKTATTTETTVPA